MGLSEAKVYDYNAAHAAKHGIGDHEALVAHAHGAYKEEMERAKDIAPEHDPEDFKKQKVQDREDILTAARHIKNKDIVGLQSHMRGVDNSVADEIIGFVHPMHQARLGYS